MTSITRRRFATGIAAAGAVAILAGPAAAQVTITVNGSGGGLAQTITKIYEEPFTKETGIKVRATAHGFRSRMPPWSSFIRFGRSGS